jgi:transposase
VSSCKGEDPKEFMKGMSQALNFGKSVADHAWGMFTTFLQYKLEEQGKKLIKISGFHHPKLVHVAVK